MHPPPFSYDPLRCSPSQLYTLPTSADWSLGIEASRSLAGGPPNHARGCARLSGTAGAPHFIGPRLLRALCGGASAGPDRAPPCGPVSACAPREETRRGYEEARRRGARRAPMAFQPPSHQGPSVEFKVVLLGDKGVGKTCLVLRFIEGTFTQKQQVCGSGGGGGGGGGVTCA